MKYYLIAGEASGDIYGGQLMSHLKIIDPDAEFRFWGGPQMQSCSNNTVVSIEQTSFMGIWEVIKNFKWILGLIKVAKSTIIEFKPDIIIFIDYPGFNLRIAKWAKSQGFKTCFYISPQLWAWKKNRYKTIKKNIDLFFVILPFEQAFFEKLGVNCEYYGHPLMEIISSTRTISDTIKTVGLFPGSRKQEIEKHLPYLIQFARNKPNYKFLLAASSNAGKDIYSDLTTFNTSNLSIVYDNAYAVMQEVDIAIASSGTVTLELALHNVPQVVIYKTSRLTFTIGKMLVKTPFISLVNLIAEKKVVNELIQGKLSNANLENAFEALQSLDARMRMLTDYEEVRQKLGDQKVSERIANKLYAYLISSSTKKAH